MIKPPIIKKVTYLRWVPLYIFFIISILSFYIGQHVTPVTSISEQVMDVQLDNYNRPFFVQKGKPVYPSFIQESQSILANGSTDDVNLVEYVVNDTKGEKVYKKLSLKKHYKYWSLLPAIMAIALCWITKEPLTSLIGGIISGALLLQKYNITEDVFVVELMTKNAAGVLILYLWLLGALMGIWSKTGAAQAFGDLMTRKFVRGPRSAKLVAWGLGVLFFQGGSVSTVLVGTTVKPITDRESISHEEVAYIVDSTASPIASQLAFNAWPGYIQSFIYVAGVSFLATEVDRISFFFRSVPFCFYAIFAVLFTFLLSIDKAPFLGRQLKDAIHRSRTTGQLDRPGSNPLTSKELEKATYPANYHPHVIDFFLPLAVLIGLAIGTFIMYGTPNVRWAFGASVIVAGLLAIARGMRLPALIQGVGEGMKGVVLGSVILMLAITIGSISQQAGGGQYLVELLGGSIPFWLLPICLQLLTIIIAFSTGTSWGTYAVAFPLAMPLAWAVAQTSDLSNPMLFMTICFAAVMDGSVFGDQCSPISDTTVLSAMCTGCDLMDHVKTQIPQASLAAGIAAVLWTLVVIVFC
ncbi:MAG: Na+/H+ antiporter NhaC family protein [Candidatus Marinamargulisbacteria bacterium]